MLAVAAHVGVLAWLSTREAGAGAAHPPAVEGTGETGVGGMPFRDRRNIHLFRVVDKDSDYVRLGGAVVRDLLGERESVTNADGVAVLSVQASAKLVVQVEKPGYAMHAEQLGNTDTTRASHTIFLERADVPYAIVDTIFIMRCVYCHGGAGKTEGIDLTTYEKVMASRWKAAPIVAAGKPEASALVRVLTDSLGADGKRTAHARVTVRVPEREIAWLAEWVRQGARRVGRP